MHTYLPSWRWVLLWAVLAALVTAVVLLAVERETSELTRYYMDVAIAVIVVTACVCAIACQYALLPRKHSTICDRKGTKGVPHHLAYITEVEMDTLIEDGGWGKTKPGMFGTQGVKCFPKRDREEESSDDEGPIGPGRTRARVMESDDDMESEDDRIVESPSEVNADAYHIVHGVRQLRAMPVSDDTGETINIVVSGAVDTTITLDADSPAVGGAKTEIERITGISVHTQALFRVVKRADKRSVREDDGDEADTHALDDYDVLSHGAEVHLLVGYDGLRVGSRLRVRSTSSSAKSSELSNGAGAEYDFVYALRVREHFHRPIQYSELEYWMMSHERMTDSLTADRHWSVSGPLVQGAQPRPDSRGGRSTYYNGYFTLEELDKVYHAEELDRVLLPDWWPTDDEGNMLHGPLPDGGWFPMDEQGFVPPSDLQSMKNFIKQVVHVSHKKAIAIITNSHQFVGRPHPLKRRDTFVGELVDRICGVLDGDAFDLSDRCKLERYVRRFTPENGMQVALIIALGQAEKPPDGGNLGANKAGQFVSALIAAVGRA